MKYLRSTTLSCKDIGIRKSEFVQAKTQFLCSCLPVQVNVEIAKIELIGPYYFVGPDMASAILFIGGKMPLQLLKRNKKIFEYLIFCI